jgi:diguanylate cyclase (GGDEF)-like protein
MALTAETDRSAEGAILFRPPHRRGRLLRLIPPTVDQPSLRAWALSVASAADQRIAELEERVAQLQDLAMTDELTGTLNRRGFLAQLMRANEAARRGGPKGVLILCDLDGFKALNDRLGHAFGDHVLRQVGLALMRGVRKMDVTARLGGDEFALLLIGADVAAARRRVQAFARALAQIAPSLGGPGTPLSASFGLAVIDGGEDETAVLHRADMAMYENKRRLRAAG